MKFRMEPNQALIQLLTHCGFLEDQREGRGWLEWDGNGLNVEISLSDGGGGSFVAPEAVNKKGRLLKSNQGNHCVPDVLITLLNEGGGWKWTATTKSGVVEITSSNKHTGVNKIMHCFHHAPFKTDQSGLPACDVAIEAEKAFL